MTCPPAHTLLALLFLLTGCRTPPPETSVGANDPRGSGSLGDLATADFIDAPGILRTLDLGTGSPLFVVYPDAEPTTRFCLLTETPIDLQQDGARVVFTGNREEIPANHRMACAPFKLLSMQHL